MLVCDQQAHRQIVSYEKWSWKEATASTYVYARTYSLVISEAGNSSCAVEKHKRKTQIPNIHCSWQMPTTRTLVIQPRGLYEQQSQKKKKVETYRLFGLSASELPFLLSPFISAGRKGKKGPNTPYNLELELELVLGLILGLVLPGS